MRLLAPLVAVFAIVGFLGSCGGGTTSTLETTTAGTLPTTTTAAGETTEVTAQLVETGSVVRVSGTEGTIYFGTYGTINATQAVTGTVGAEPTDYPVPSAGPAGTIVANFQKTAPGDEGTLTVQILSDGTVTAEDQTAAEFGVVNLTWGL